MNRFRSVTAAVLVAGLLAGGAVFAQGPDGSGRGGRRAGPGGPGGVADLPLAQLNLTDTQRQQIRDLTQNQRAAREQVQQRLRAAMEARRVAINTIPVNEGAIRSTTAEVVAAETDVAIQEAHLRADIIALLTPQQQDQLKKAQAQRQARVESRRDRQQDRPAQRQR